MQGKVLKSLLKNLQFCKDSTILKLEPYFQRFYETSLKVEQNPAKLTYLPSCIALIKLDFYNNLISILLIAAIFSLLLTLFKGDAFPFMPMGCEGNIR